RGRNRAQVDLRRTRAARPVGGAGVEIDAKRRVGQAAGQRTLDLAVRGHDEDREVLEVVRSQARRGAIVSHPPTAAEVDGRSGVAEDAIGRDLVAGREVAWRAA